MKRRRTGYDGGGNPVDLGEWDEEKHPRDEKGRFAAGDSVEWRDDDTGALRHGKVVTDAGGDVRVRRGEYDFPKGQDPDVAVPRGRLSRRPAAPPSHDEMVKMPTGELRDWMDRASRTLDDFFDADKRGYKPGHEPWSRAEQAAMDIIQSRGGR